MSVSRGTKNKVKWMGMQCLMGGAAFGAQEAFGCLPERMYTFDSVLANEQHIMQYWKKKVKWTVMDGSCAVLTGPEDTPKDVDVVVAVPFCSGLSQLNSCSNKDSKYARGADACQNENMYLISEFVLGTVGPKVMVGENAPNLYGKVGDPVKDRLREIGDKHGYSFSVYKTNTLSHGIPQNRERTFFFFWKGDRCGIVDWYDRPRPGLTEFLSAIPADAEYHDVELARQRVQDNPGWIYLKKIRKGDPRELKEEGYRSVMGYITADDKRHDDCIEWARKNGYERFADKLSHVKGKLGDGKGFWDASIHFYGDSHVNAAVNKNLGNTLHPTEDRLLTVREFMHLMGMPDDFKFVDGVDWKRCLRQVTQNVPVCTARDMCLSAAKFVEGTLPLSDGRYLKQTNLSKKIEEGSASSSLGEFL